MDARALVRLILAVLTVAAIWNLSTSMMATPVPPPLVGCAFDVKP